MTIQAISVRDINAKTASCGCAETYITEEDASGKATRRYLPEVKWHNCAYIKDRKKNIWSADKAAKAEVAHLSGEKGWGSAFTRAFSARMDELSAGI